MSRSSRSSIKDRLKDVGIVAPRQYADSVDTRDTSQTPRSLTTKDNDLAFFLRRMRMPIGSEMGDLEEPITPRRKKSTDRQERLRREALVSPPPKKEYLYGSYKLADKRDEKKAASNRSSRVEREMKSEMESFYNQQANSKYKFETRSLLNASDDEEPLPVRYNKEAEKDKMMEMRARRCEKESWSHRPPNTRYKYRNDKLEFTDDEDDEAQEKPKSRYSRKKKIDDRDESDEDLYEKPKSRFLRKKEDKEESVDRDEGKETDPSYYRFLFSNGAKYAGRTLEAKVLGRKTPTEREEKPLIESEEEDYFPRPTFNGTRKKKDSPKPEAKTNGRKKPTARKVLDDSEDDEDLFRRPSPAKKRYGSCKSPSPYDDMNGYTKDPAKEERRKAIEQALADLSDDEEPFNSFNHRPAVSNYESYNPDEPSLQVREREKERRERERRNSSYHDVEEISSNKIKDEMMYFKNHKPTRSMDRFKKQTLTNPALYRSANKVDPLMEANISFRPEKEVTYRYGSYKVSDK